MLGELGEVGLGGGRLKRSGLLLVVERIGCGGGIPYVLWLILPRSRALGWHWWLERRTRRRGKIWEAVLGGIRI